MKLKGQKSPGHFVASQSLSTLHRSKVLSESSREPGQSPGRPARLPVHLAELQSSRRQLPPGPDVERSPGPPQAPAAFSRAHGGPRCRAGAGPQSWRELWTPAGPLLPRHQCDQEEVLTHGRNLSG